MEQRMGRTIGECALRWLALLWHCSKVALRTVALLYPSLLQPLPTVIVRLYSTQLTSPLSAHWAGPRIKVAGLVRLSVNAALIRTFGLLVGAVARHLDRALEALHER